MGQRKDIDGSASVPTFYGKELRWKREDAGLTLLQLVEGSFYGPEHRRLVQEQLQQRHWRGLRRGRRGVPRRSPLAQEQL